MKKLFIVLFILVSSLLYAEEKQFENPMSMYNDNYIIAGDVDNQVKFQISAKYNLLWPSQTGLYIGYTQLTNWFIYNHRDTMYSTYEPEFFYCYESGHNIFNDSKIPFVDFIRVSPIEHNSTGVEGINHRGINIYYGQIQFSYGDVYNIGFNIKGFNYYSVSNYNKDIAEYKGYQESDIFFKLRSTKIEYLDKEELHFKFGGYSVSKGWYCIEAKFRIISTYVQPKLFIQYYKGTCEFITYYNRKDNVVRAGFVF